MGSGHMADPVLRLGGPLGAVASAHRVRTDGWLPPRYEIYAAYTGNPSAVAGPYDRRARAGYGTGRAYGDPGRARLLAVSEALERYASLMADPRRIVCSPASALGSAALDLDRVPRCSVAELRRPGCPVSQASKDDEIRWVAGIDLHSGADVLLPAVMVYLQPPQLPGERFWLPVSTGCAGHVAAESAVLNAILEGIERDALAITWLQRIPLPRLADQCLSPTSAELIEWCGRHGITTYLFDATTDLGIPVVYCLQTTDHTLSAAQLVSCACDFDAAQAAEHAIMETMGIRFGVQRTRTVPRRYAGFSSVNDGAVMMGRRQRRAAFGFLLDGVGGRPVTTPPASSAGTDLERLSIAVSRLSALGMSAYAADLSTREMEGTGYSAVRVIIPEAQPMSARPLAQYRGHPRLAEAPVRMGFTARRARDLNPYPQPMA